MNTARNINIEHATTVFPWASTTDAKVTPGWFLECDVSIELDNVRCGIEVRRSAVAKGMSRHAGRRNASYLCAEIKDLGET